MVVHPVGIPAFGDDPGAFAGSVEVGDVEGEDLAGAGGGLIQQPPQGILPEAAVQAPQGGDLLPGQSQETRTGGASQRTPTAQVGGGAERSCRRECGISCGFTWEWERGATTNTGSGIVLGSVRGGVVEDSTAHDNGAASTAQQGPIGIWAYDSTRIVLQRNVAFDNPTQFADGGGFGLDQNTSDSSLQYNLSYGNDGGGYLLFTNQPNGFHRGNVVRFNISSEDARHGANYGGFMVGGGFAGPATATVVRGDQIYPEHGGDDRP